jgi:hypothetical protein
VTFAPVETKGTKAQSRSADENLKLTETGNRQSLIEHKVRGGQLRFTETAQNETGKWDAILEPVWLHSVIDCSGLGTTNDCDIMRKVLVNNF